MDEYNKNFLGKWNLKIDTPFGEEECYFDISILDNIAHYKIYNEKGFVNLQQKNNTKNFIMLVGKTEFPIPCTLTMNLSLDDDNLFGQIKVDNYLQVNFVGEK